VNRAFSRQRSALASAAVCLGISCLGVAAGPASAAGTSYEFDEPLSLRGDCGVGAPDNVPDPGCPGGSHPAKGRFAEPRSIATDAYGNEYVMSAAFNGEPRIDVFDDEGNFITELLDPQRPKSIAVDSEGNLYAFEQSGGAEAEVARYSPTVYEPEVGEIEYGASRVVIATESAFLGGLAIDVSNDHLYVAHAGSFHEEYSSAKEGNALLHTIELPDFAGASSATSWSNWVAVDAQRRRLYVSYCKDEIEECGVLALSADPPYTLLKEIDGSTTPAGRFLSQKGWISTAVDESTGHFFAEDLEGTKNIYEFDQNFEYFSTTSFSKFEGTNSLQIAVSNSPLDPTARNHGYLFVPFPKESGAAFAFHPPLAGPPDVEVVAATNISEREAELHATVDPNGATTDYVFEYVTQEEFDEEGFSNARSSGAGTIPIGSSRMVVASIGGLSPGTSYRFRVLASNEVDEDEKEGSFSTYADAPVAGGCPNQSLRIGVSSSLPDCRAYELVTPADTNGRPPKGVGFGGDRFPTLESSASGNVVAFVTEGGSLPGTGGTGGFNGDLYRSVRGTAGWGVVRMGPSGTETNNPSPGSTSPDQEHAFFWAGGEGSAVVNGLLSHYVRYPDGRAELVGRGSLGTDPSAVGQMIADGGTHIIFQTGNVGQQLEPEAAPSGTDVLYDRTPDEVTHVVSLLPGDVTPKALEDANYLDASADGTGIAFSIGNKLYLRLDDEVTFEIGENVTLVDVSQGGRRVFYLKAGDLFAFDSETEEVIRFTETGNARVVNVAPDGSRAYFVSSTAIVGSGENPNGATPKAGQRNLYLAEQDQIRFVGIVTARDVEGALGADGLGLWTEVQALQPAKDPSRVNSDGSVLLFQSRAILGSYDPKGIPQIYRYDSGANGLHCISCPPTGGSATGGAGLETFAVSQTTRPPFTAYGFVPNLRGDGAHAFFESTEALVSADTDGVQDVYEWEAQGVGSCTQPGGCVYLISSGHSARANYLYGLSRSGDDVFFVTEDVLVGGDNDTASIYDARVGGGFPEQRDELCQGEACHLPVTPAPTLTTPGTPAPGADDNVKPASGQCPRGKRKVKIRSRFRCVKKHGKKQHRKAGSGKGARR